MKDKELLPCPFDKSCKCREQNCIGCETSAAFIADKDKRIAELENDRDAWKKRAETNIAFVAPADNSIPIKSHHCHTTHTACDCVLDRLDTLEGTCENLADDNVEKERRIEELGEQLLKATLSIDEEQYAEKQLRQKIEKLEAQLRWIPLSEGLPEESDPVLVVSKFGIAEVPRVAQFEGWDEEHGFAYFVDFTTTDRDKVIDNITHWKPITLPTETEK